MNKFPLYQRDNIENLKELVDRGAALYGDKEAIVWTHKGKKYSKSYQNIKSDSENIKNGISQIPLRLGHIAILGRTCYEWIIAYLGIVNSNNVVIPIDKELSEQQISKLLTIGDAECLIYADDYEDMIQYFKENNKVITYFIKFSELIETFKNSKDNEISIDNEKMCAILFTSGTMGESKGVMLSHKNIAKNIICGCSVVDLSTNDKCLSMLPINHAYEFTCDILGMLYLGVTIYINDSLKNLSKNFLNYKPTIMFVIPLFVETMHRRIWDEARKKNKEKKLKFAIKLSNLFLKLGIDVRHKLFKEVLGAFGGELKKMLCGGAPLNHEYIEEFKSFGINLIQGYGITECSPLVAVNSDRWSKKNSVGQKVIYSGVKIIDDEICVKGDIVMLGYYKNEAATKEAFDGLWFKTGDLGRIDEDGFIYLFGRKKNLIIMSNGENVSAEELESIIQNIAGVKEVLVYGKENIITAEIYPDMELNYDVTYIRKKIDDINRKLPRYKQVNSVIFRDKEFEKTTTRKIKRNGVN